ncbi:probable LRR receptor-like serine/threonine-protein kinase At1g05700 [Typha angustifolia]|uniref:probable LRR receptor-like serine/threonine-protein kinase At1g05700 n=1 Tax=Typha angustifolia TaxID=59011 RepID=UPI003C2AB056
MAMRLCFGTQVLRYFALIGFFAGAITVHGQPGFVSIDCGTSADSSYTDNRSGIEYTPDSQYIDTGINYEITKDYILDWHPKHLGDLRSFPNGSLNCYTINHVNQGGKYLIRGSFLYGNYDGQQSASSSTPLLFNLYIGVNFWETMNITAATDLYFAEIITIATRDYFSICLENIKSGNPFISALELRFIGNPNVYVDVTPSTSLVLFVERVNLGASIPIIRYPNDIYDRIWGSYKRPDLTPINTLGVQYTPDDTFQVPSLVMNTAVTPTDNTSLTFEWDSDSGEKRPVYYIYMHFAELKFLQKPTTRSFDVFVNGELRKSNFQPEYLLTNHINLTSDLGTATLYKFNITRAAASTLPPIINAVEIYSTMYPIRLATDRGDVEGMMELKVLYRIKIWQGDPCAPEKFAWEGVNCTYSASNPPRVTTLNLSSHGLTGGVPAALTKLKAIKYLDISNNNLSGSIPDFLADLQSLAMLNLSGNQLSGSIPDALLQKQARGLFYLEVGNNPKLCLPGNKCTSSPGSAGFSRKTPTTVVIATVIPTVSFMKSLINSVLHLVREVEVTVIDGKPLKADQFTYLELKTITNNFGRVLGRGGFGTVYYGCLKDGLEVAVKMCSHNKSPQATSCEPMSQDLGDHKAKGSKEFWAEALLLSRIHHRNLVCLVGFCKEINCLALIYEYMPQGSLRDHLIGTYQAGKEKFLSWRKRTEIAVDAALGLEYLHEGCTPPIVHRDVKTSNILLSSDLKAKLADFGLSKAFNTDADTHISTNIIVGTPGYLDPEYHNTFQLTEKSDVYSFGVVLLELITGLPAVLKSRETGHIVQWVHKKLSKGHVTEVVDARLHGKYDIDSVWKVADIATRCTTPVGSQRPRMSEVVMELKESLHLLEIPRGSTMHNAYVDTLDARLQSESIEVMRRDMRTSTTGPVLR